jgi:hypothetical protein
MVCFDGTCPDFDQEPWNDPEHSPLSLSESGTCVLLNPHALTALQQKAVAASIARYHTTQTIASLPPMGFVLALHKSVDSPYEDLPLDESIRNLYPITNTVLVPPLSERPEDLRATIYERAARLGLVIRGNALGVAPAALAELLEYDWPQNDLELENTLTALVLVARDDTITTLDLETIGFAPDRKRVQRDTDEAKARSPRQRHPRVTTRATKPRER